MRKIRVAAAVIAVSATAAAAEDTPTYDLVVAGMTCKQSPLSNERQLDCYYRIGRGLAFTIAGVGQLDAAITVEKAEGFDSDYYFTFGMMHGCVVIKPGQKTNDAALKAGKLPDMAFVSPKTGKVYRTWKECQKTSK